MTFSWCDVHTQLFSLKIAGVEQILSMQQPLTVWAVSGAGAKRLREERLARAGAAQAKALAIGLPWPKPAKGAGRPSARKHWHDVLYASIIAGDELPDDVGLEPPAWWKRGDGLSPPEAPPAEASEALDHVDADPEPGHVEVSPMKKRKKVILDPRLKNWFLCFAELQRARHGGDMQRSLAEAKRLCPCFSQIHKDTPRRWQKLPSEPSVMGRPAVLSEAQITLLTGVVAKVTARVPLCASVICDVMEVELDKIGVAWRPSIRWVRTFLLKLGLSYKRAGGCLLKEPALAVKLDLQQNLQQKVLWTQHKFGIADARVINVDETSLRMIPVSATGWSVKGEKTKQVQAGKSNITATLAVPMLQGPSFCQLIFGGKTSAVLPHGSVEHDVHLNFTESHWQSTESMFSFVQFLEKVLNPTDEQRPWILLLDCASVHTASAFRQQLHSQLPWVKSIYIPGGSTAYNQPLDRSMMKSFKSAIARKASRHFAEQILLVDSLDLSARFLKPVIATWVHEVINDISSRRDIFQTAWAHILPKNPEHAASILLAAGEAHVAEKSLQIEQGGRRTRDSTGR